MPVAVELELAKQLVSWDRRRKGQRCTLSRSGVG